MSTESGWFDITAAARLLAEYKKKDEVVIDYSILAVMVGTLGLILVVELGRHNIDHRAHHRPFFKAVLDGVYSELSTLGIVEAAVYIMLAYWDDIDKAKKEVFGYCHFLLFYTAMFNVVQCCVQAFAAMRASHKLWVRTEDLELSHYVALREEFDILKPQIEQLALTPKNKHNPFANLRWWLLRIRRELVNHQTLHKYRRLLSMIRFHELRLHFLRSNNLPVTLKVSDYLNESELSVLKGMVGISALAWVFFTSAVNLSYFTFGMIADIADGDETSIALAMAYTFVASNVFFLSLAIVLYVKVQYIFVKMLDMDVRSIDPEELKQKQLSLFWGNEPSVVVSLIQFMQFGYAISAASLLIFWRPIHNHGEVDSWILLITVLVCYSLFVVVIGEVLPRYTMCTSLWALVDKERLLEMTARQKLEEAKLAASFVRESIDRNDGTFSESEKTAGSTSQLTQISELVETKTEDLRSVRLAAGDTLSLRSATSRSSRRQKSFSDSRSIAMMRMYGSTYTITENKDASAPPSGANTPTGMSSISPSPSAGDLISLQNDSIRVDTLSQRIPTSVNVDTESVDNKEDCIQMKPIMRGMLTKTVTPSNTEEENEEAKETHLSAYDIFFSTSYVLCSEVFGTMLCFFYVAMRVEGLLLSNDIIVDAGSTFLVPHSVTFWLEVSWLFIMISSSVLLLFGNVQRDPTVDCACAIDVLITAVCLSMLLLAESKRCCESDESCCGNFGTRTYGDVGNIEPFTSLIAFRAARFYVAKLVVSVINKNDKGASTNHDDHEGDGHHDHSFDVDTAIHLWIHTVVQHPELVEKDGAFSSAVLKTMLGLDPKLDVSNVIVSVPNDTHKDIELSARQNLAIEIDELIMSEAPLILRMRRADWMAPPLLDHWRPVDILVTEYEIVIVEAMDISTTDGFPLKFRKEMVTCQEMTTTKGGIGMTLQDVLSGRRILSHIRLSSIDSLHVEPHKPDHHHPKCDENYAGNELKGEYWEGESAPLPLRTDRWLQVTENRMKIHVEEGNVMLIRFYCDLVAQEYSRTDPSSVEALIWCKTIGRVRGSNHLIQKLPNFGRDDDSELKDYLLMHHHQHRHSTSAVDWVKKITSHTPTYLKSHSRFSDMEEGEP